MWIPFCSFVKTYDMHKLSSGLCSIIKIIDGKWSFSSSARYCYYSFNYTDTGMVYHLLHLHAIRLALVKSERIFWRGLSVHLWPTLLKQHLDLTSCGLTHNYAEVVTTVIQVTRLAQTKSREKIMTFLKTLIASKLFLNYCKRWLVEGRRAWRNLLISSVVWDDLGMRTGRL